MCLGIVNFDQELQFFFNMYTIVIYIQLIKWKLMYKKTMRMS